MLCIGAEHMLVIVAIVHLYVHMWTGGSAVWLYLIGSMGFVICTLSFGLNQIMTFNIPQWSLGFVALFDCIAFPIAYAYTMYGALENILLHVTFLFILTTFDILWIGFTALVTLVTVPLALTATTSRHDKLAMYLGQAERGSVLEGENRTCSAGTAFNQLLHVNDNPLQISLARLSDTHHMRGTLLPETLPAFAISPEVLHLGRRLDEVECSQMLLMSLAELEDLLDFATWTDVVLVLAFIGYGFSLYRGTLRLSYILLLSNKVLEAPMYSFPSLAAMESRVCDLVRNELDYFGIFPGTTSVNYNKESLLRDLQMYLTYHLRQGGHGTATGMQLDQYVFTDYLSPPHTSVAPEGGASQTRMSEVMGWDAQNTSQNVPIVSRPPEALNPPQRSTVRRRSAIKHLALFMSRTDRFGNVKNDPRRMRRRRGRVNSSLFGIEVDRAGSTSMTSNTLNKIVSGLERLEIAPLPPRGVGFSVTGSRHGRDLVAPLEALLIDAVANLLVICMRNDDENRCVKMTKFTSGSLLRCVTNNMLSWKSFPCEHLRRRHENDPLKYLSEVPIKRFCPKCDLSKQVKALFLGGGTVHEMADIAGLGGPLMGGRARSTDITSDMLNMFADRMQTRRNTAWSCRSSRRWSVNSRTPQIVKHMNSEANQRSLTSTSNETLQAQMSMRESPDNARCACAASRSDDCDDDNDDDGSSMDWYSDDDEENLILEFVKGSVAFSEQTRATAALNKIRNWLRPCVQSLRDNVQVRVHRYMDMLRTRLSEFSLTRQLTVFTASNPRPVLLPRMTAVKRVFKCPLIENWYTEWLQKAAMDQTLHVKDMAFLTVCLLLHVGLEMAKLVMKGPIAKKVHEAQWAPYWISSSANVLEVGGIYIPYDASVAKYDQSSFRLLLGMIMALRLLLIVLANGLLLQKALSTGNVIEALPQSIVSQRRAAAVNLWAFVTAATHIGLGEFDLWLSTFVLHKFSAVGHRTASTTVYGALIIAPLIVPGARVPPMLLLYTVFLVIHTVICSIACSSLPELAVNVSTYLAFASTGLFIIHASYDHTRRQIFGRNILPHLLFLLGLNRWQDTLHSTRFCPSEEAIPESITLLSRGRRRSGYTSVSHTGGTEASSPSVSGFAESDESKNLLSRLVSEGGEASLWRGLRLSSDSQTNNNDNRHWEDLESGISADTKNSFTQRSPSFERTNSVQSEPAIGRRYASDDDDTYTEGARTEVFPSLGSRDRPRRLLRRDSSFESAWVPNPADPELEVYQRGAFESRILDDPAVAAGNLMRCWECCSPAPSRTLRAVPVELARTPPLTTRLGGSSIRVGPEQRRARRRRRSVGLRKVWMSSLLEWTG